MASWETWNRDDVAPTLSRTPIVVVCGGNSFEREVSLTSGRAVRSALSDLSGRSYEVAPPIHGVEIDASGAWRVDDVPLTPQRAVEALPDDAVYLLALHGGSGEDGRVQAFLELAGRRYTGSGSQVSALCMNKHHTRLVASEAGIAVAPGAFATRTSFLADEDAAIARLTGSSDGVRFVKHATAGSSFQVHRCSNDDEVAAAAREVANSGGDVLVEAGVAGLETTVGVIGDGGAATALPVAEIVPRASNFFDHQQKYDAEGGADEYCPPKFLPPNIAARLQERARKTWDALGGTSYARIDFMVPCRQDRDGGRAFDDDVEPVLLEANTLPGFTPRSLLPLAASKDGVDFRELCLELVARSLQRS